MATKYTIKQGSINGVASRDIGFDIPEEGEIFKSGGSNQLMYMKGGQIFQAPSGMLSNEEKVALGGSPAGIVAAETKRFLDEAGVDYGGDVNKFVQGLRSQNVGDLQTAGLVKVQNQQMQIGQGVASDFKSVYDAFVSGNFGKASGASETITGPGAQTYKDVPGYVEPTAGGSSGKSYVNASGAIVTPKTAQEEANMVKLGFKESGTTGQTGTPATVKKEVGGNPGSSDEYDQWIAMGRTWENGKWYEPGSSGGAPGGDVGGGGGDGGNIPGGGTPNIPSLSFNLDEVISGQFNTDDLMDIFSSPIGQGDIDKLLDENLKLRQQFLDSLNPTAEEIQLKSDLSDLRNEIQVAQLNYRKGVANIQQGLVSTRVMTGQEEALYTQTQLGMQTLAIQESNLLSRLGLEQESREASARVIGAALEFNDSDINRLNTMQNQIFNQKMAMFNVMSQFSTRAQNTLNLVLDGMVGIDAEDLDNATITKLQSMTKSAGIPWEVVQQSLKVKKDEYQYNQYMGDLDRQVKEAQLANLESGGGSNTPDFTNSQKLELEQAGIDWNDPVGRQKALDFLYKQGPESVEEMMTQYKGLIQQYKTNNFSKVDAESLVRSENGIKEDEEIPGPYQDVIDEIYGGAKKEEKVSAWQRFVNWLKSPVETRK